MYVRYVSKTVDLSLLIGFKRQIETKQITQGVNIREGQERSKTKHKTVKMAYINGGR